MALRCIVPRRCPGMALFIAIAMLCAACSGSGSGTGPDDDIEPAVREDGANASPPPATMPDAAAPAARPAAAAHDAAVGATVGGDGSEIVLVPLSATDIETAKLTGELGCSFSIGDGPPLLFAMGNVASKEPSRGVVKVGDYVEAVSAAGGFDAMLKGARFTGAGKTVGIALTGAATGTGESPPAPATLTYDRADGARRSYVGQWQCGP